MASSANNESGSSNDNEVTPPRSVRTSGVSQTDSTPRRSVRASGFSDTGSTPRRSIEASTSKLTTGNRTQRQTPIHLAPRRSSQSTGRASAANDSQQERSQPGPSRANQRRSSPNPRQRARKQSKPLRRKDRIIKEIINMQKSYSLLIPLASFQRYV